MTRATGVALMIAAPVLWSSAGVVTRHLQSAQPFEQVFWRSLFAFCPRRSALSESQPVESGAGGGLPGLVSGLMWATMFTAFLFALLLTTTANALVVMSSQPAAHGAVRKHVPEEPVPLRTLACGGRAVGIAAMFGSSMEKHFRGMAVAFLILVAAAINVVVLRASAAARPRPAAVMLGGAPSCLIALPLPCLFSSTGRDIALLAFLGITQLGSALHAGARQPRAARAGNRAARPARRGARSALGLARRGRGVPRGSTLLGGMDRRSAPAANELPTPSPGPQIARREGDAAPRLFAVFPFSSSPWATLKATLLGAEVSCPSWHWWSARRWARLRA